MKSVVVSKAALSEGMLMQLMRLDEGMGDLVWDRGAWVSLVLELHRHFLMVMLDDERNSSPVMGFALFLLSEEERLAHLLKIVIDPTYRTRGLGRLLLSDAVHLLESEGFHKVFLEVERSNERALHLYEKMNFIKLHLCRDFYGSKRDAYKMLLELRKEEDGL